MVVSTYDTSGNAKITYDDNGTAVKTNGPINRFAKMDGWNRVAATTRFVVGTTTAVQYVSYGYDALGRMIRTRQIQADFTLTVDTTFYYSAGWQAMTETGYTNTYDSEHILQTSKAFRNDNVWSMSYVDAMVFQQQKKWETIDATLTPV